MAGFEAIGKALQIDDKVLKKLDAVDTKINKIATDSEKMATIFQSAISKIGISSDNLLKKLQTIQSTINKLDVSKFAQSVQNVGRGATQVEQFANAISKAAAAINKYNAENRKRSDVDNSKQIAQLNKEIEAMRKRTQQLEDYINKQRQANNSSRGGSTTDARANTQALNAYNRAMASSEALVTQRINKIAKLRQAEEMLRATGRNYQTQLQRIQQEITRLNKLNEGQVDRYGRIVRSQHNLMNTSQQLTRQLALVFSVSAIEGYISKLVQVRGEFELQQTALASILQNKDQADQLFAQITELAVRSPFTIKELNSYTKQLAAYQIQYEDLYDTTKMLADVSSGLGVDMGRLILAFGQVKAANILRGTEVRQFTEAGLNILGDLAKYYSELEGRMISVGEVQDMVTRRMVSFGDVEEVFKRVTSAGGMFYNMQEKQADTLRGQMMNLQDQIDLMLNDIGKSNQGVLSNVISILKSIIENWETIAQVMTPILTMLAAYIAYNKLLASGAGLIAKSWKIIKTNVLLAVGAINKAEAAQRGFNKASRLNAWVAILSVAVTIIWEIVSALRAANKEQEELNKIASQGFFDAQKSSANYERLANVISDSTASYKEQSEALSELKRTYGDILPAHYLEAEAIRGMKGDYDEATNAIRNYIQAKTQEKQISYISEEYGEKVQDWQELAAKDIQEQVNSLYDAQISMNEINIIMTRFRKDFEEGLIKSPQDASKRMQELLSDFLDMDVNIRFMRNSLYQYYYSLEKLQQKVEEVSNMSTVNIGDRITMRLQEERENLDKQIKEANELLNVISHQGEIGEDGALITPMQVTVAKKRLSEIVRQWGLDTKYIQELTGGAFEIKQASLDITKAALAKFVSDLSQMTVNENQKASLQMFIQNVNEEIANMDSTPFQRFISNIITSSAKANDVSLDGLISVFAGADESVADYTKRISAKAEQLQKDLQLYKKNPALVPQWTDDPNAAKEAAKQLKVYLDILKRIKIEEGGGESEELKTLKEQLKIIKQVVEAYRKYREYMGKEDARNLAEQLAEGTSAKDIVANLSFDTSELIKGLEEFSKDVAKRVGAEGQKAVDDVIREYKEKNVIDIEVQGIEEAQQRVQDIFSDYEFSLDLKTKGIDPNSFKNMLKSVGASDEEISMFGLDTTTFEEAQKKLRDEIAALQAEGGDKQIEAARKIQEQLTDLEIKEANKRYDELLKLREKYQTNAKKISEIESDIAEWQAELDKIKKLGESGNQTQKELLEYRIQNGKDAILQLRSEALQLTDFWETLFGDLGEISVKSIRDIMRQRDEIIDNIDKNKPITNNQGETIGYTSSFIDAKGTKQEVQMTIGQYNQLIKSYKNLKNEYRQRNPLGNFIDTLKEGRKKGESYRDFITRLAEDFDATAAGAFEAANSIMEITGASDTAMQDLQSIQSMVKGVTDIATGFASGNPFAIIGGVTSMVGAIMQLHDNKREKIIENELDKIEELDFAYQKLSDTIENGLSIDTYKMQSNRISILMAQINSYRAMIEAERDKKNTDEDRIRDWEESIYEAFQTIRDSYQELTEQLTGNFKSLAQQMGDAIVSALKEGEDAAIAWGDTMNDIFVQVLQNAFTMKILEPMMQDLTDQIDALMLPKTSAAEKKLEEVNRQQAIVDDLEEKRNDRTFKWDKEMSKRYENEKKKLEELEKEFEQMNKAAEGEEIRTPSYNEIRKLYQQWLESSDAALYNDMMELLQQFIDDNIRGNRTDQMTGLQKGITSVTEQTAQALEALLESIRLFVSTESTTVQNIYNFLIAPPAESPLMQQLTLQSQRLGMIYDLWNSVIKSVPSSGKAVRVQIV